MNSGRKWAIGVGAVVLAVGAVVGVRTAGFASPVAPPATLTSTPPPVDLDTAARRLGEAVRFTTVSNQDAARNDWTQWDALHRWLIATYPAAHGVMQRETVAGRTLVYRWPGSDPSADAIILMAHQDVVPVTPGSEGGWRHAPFAGVLTGDAVWGRGTVDDKGSLVALFEAFDALAAQGFRPRRDVYLVSGHDEEVGGTGARAAAALLQSRGVRAHFTLDEGSAIILDAPIVDGPAILIGVAEKGYATLRVTAPSAGGHSSMPPPETGAITLARALLAINDRPFPVMLRGPGGDMLAALGAHRGGATRIAVANGWLFGPLLRAQASGSPASAAIFRTTIAPTMLSGSPKENVLPQSASALINYRIAPWDRSADILAHARRAVADVPVTLEWVSPPREPSRVSSVTSPGWRLIAAAAAAQAPRGAALAPYLVVGGTDGRSFEGISDDVYRFMPMHFTIAQSAMIHGTNEHMSRANLRRLIHFYADLIQASAR